MFKNRLARRSRVLSRSVSAIDTLESRKLFSVAVGLTSTNQLVTFDTATPATQTAPVTITGLANAETIVGIDYRPASGVLFGLGSTGQLYTLNVNTGAATAVGTGVGALTGTNFGFDFNPVVDRIRIVSDADTSLRANPNDGTLAATDTSLAYAVADANFGADPNVTAVAYLNNFNGATTTTLFGIDTSTNSLVSIVPPNAGTLNTIGALGIDVDAAAGFDISSVDGVGYATLSVGGVSSLYTINLTTGAATLVGATGATTLTDVAVAPTTFYALASTGTSIGRFSTSNLSTPTIINITGLAANDTLTSIDFRPATGQLWGVGTSGQLYTIAVSGASAGTATAVGTGLGTTSIATVAEIDFNPTVDRIRVIGAGDENARANPNNGAYVDTDTTTAGTQLDTALSYTGGNPNPNVIAVAYTNPVGNATSTTLYGIDAGTDQLITVGTVAGVTPVVSPNAGALSNVGALGVDATSGGFDIGVGGLNLAALNVVGTAATGLYSINTTTGAATLIGALGDGTVTFSDIAIANTVINLSAATATVSESGGNLVVTVNRNDGAGAASVTVTAAASGNNTATGGVDFGTANQATFSGVVTFADGETSKTINIPILADTTDEANETFTVTLSDPSVGSSLGTTTQTVTITDDDNPTVTISDATVAEGGVLTFTVTLSAASTQTVSVDVASDTTGTAGTNDFTALTTTTLTFAPGETTKTITIQTTQDSDVEPNETVNVLLSNAVNADLTTDVTGTGTITNDDAAPGVTGGDDAVRTGTKNKVLTIQGTGGNDVILVGTGAGGTITVSLNGANQTLPSDITKKNLYRIVILGGAGDDEIRVNSKVNYSVEAYGEAGNDFIYGGKQRDLLVGGDGIDSLYGGAGDDILVAGSLNFGTANALTATATLLNAWLGKGNFSQRVGAITGAGTGGFSFSSTTVVDDADRDYLFGQGSADLISRNSASQDVVADESNKGRTDTFTTPNT